MRIDYLVSDDPTPSWGTGLLYEHVRLLRELGHQARILHHRAPFRVGWIDSDVPVAHLDALEREPAEDDLLIVPEVLAAEAARLPWRCRRGVFVQGSFLIVAGLGGAADYPALGYSFAFAVLPHVSHIVEAHFGLPAEVVPPFVAPYFFQDPERIRSGRRQRTILLAAKPEYRRAGFPDYDIVTRLLDRYLGSGDGDGGWRVVELAGMTHAEVARRMAEAAFLVNLNSHEAFNSTVPEAMAAGCLPICYEAFGGRDFLVDGDNAFVLPNHHAFPLVDRTLEAVAAFERQDEALVAMRLRARAGAGRFTVERTRRVLAQAVARLASRGGRG